MRDVKLIEASEFNALVEQTYQRPYSIQHQYRSYVKFSVPADDYDYTANYVDIEDDGASGVCFAAWLARDVSQPFNPQGLVFQTKLFWYRNFYPALEMVVNDLHAKGLLPVGEYVVLCGDGR